MSTRATVTLDRDHAEALYALAGRGLALQNWLAATAHLGHASPGSTLDYLPATADGSPESFVRDFVAWTSGRKDSAPGCDSRLREFGAASARDTLTHVLGGAA